MFRAAALVRRTSCLLGGYLRTQMMVIFVSVPPFSADSFATPVDWGLSVNIYYPPRPRRAVLAY